MSQLGSVETLHLDGGSSIYPYIWYFWDGEDETFDVATFAGIEHCPNITRFVASALVDVVDLGQLVPLRRLRTVRLGVPAKTLEALLDFRDLAEVKLLRGSDLAGEAVISTLKARRRTRSCPVMIKTLYRVYGWHLDADCRPRLVIVCGAHPVCPSALVVALKAIFVRSRSRVAISEKGLATASENERPQENKIRPTAPIEVNSYSPTSLCLLCFSSLAEFQRINSSIKRWRREGR